MKYMLVAILGVWLSYPLLSQQLQTPDDLRQEKINEIQQDNNIKSVSMYVRVFRAQDTITSKLITQHYNRLGQKIKSEVRNSVTEYTYDEKGNIQEQKFYRGDQLQGISVFVTNDQGQVISTKSYKNDTLLGGKKFIYLSRGDTSICIATTLEGDTLHTEKKYSAGENKIIYERIDYPEFPEIHTEWLLDEQGKIKKQIRTSWQGEKREETLWFSADHLYYTKQKIGDELYEYEVNVDNGLMKDAKVLDEDGNLLRIVHNEFVRW